MTSSTSSTSTTTAQAASTAAQATPAGSQSRSPYLSMFRAFSMPFISPISSAIRTVVILAARALSQTRLPYLSMFGAFSIPLFSRISSIFAVRPVAIQTASVFASIKVKDPIEHKTIYSPEEFKRLLLQKHPFPPNVIVTGDLDLSNFTELTSLPMGLTIQGNLHLSNCRGLTPLPEGLTVRGDLNLYSSDLTSLPKGLTVQGNLSLSSCTRLRSLPEGLTVGGDLILFLCTGITSLPERLTVQGSLTLVGCTGITSLPERLTVQGNLGLSHCPGLTSLPNWITTLGPLANGTTRQISLEGTGLSEALLNRLRETPTPGIQFHFSHAAAVPTQTFPDLDTALTFWVKATNEATLANPPITIDSDEALSEVLRFLSRLTETAEYKNPQTRPVLAMRVIEAFSLMAENEPIKGRALEIIHEGLISCDDRIISALEEIELMVLLHQIENTPHTETELKALGKRFLLLEMVDEKAEAHKSTLTWVDEIEIYLAFRIGLAVKLDLPVKTRNMIFRGCAQITDEQIKQAGDAVLSECTEEKLNNFLKDWSPWIKHQKKTAPVPAYETLPVTDRKLASSDKCPITLGVPEKPVLCGHEVYDYEVLMHYYRIDGRNPVDRSPIDLEKLKRLDTSAAVSNKTSS